MSGAWEKIQQLFEAALDVAPEDRRAFLEERLGSDRDSIERVERMLQADARTGLSLDRRPQTLSDELLGEIPPAPATIGPYRIEGELGRGGMGVVYRGSREDLDSAAAIKVLYGTALSPLRRELFDRERRVLAALQHPGIARLYDAGTLEDGTPYFVMEMVEGQPLSAACNRENLTLTARLDLFLEACSAVQYAHARGVIHRDLKSSNLLVTDDGGPSRIKLLDFGVARRMDREDEEEGQGRPEAAAFTPAYAAPEQVAGEAATVQTDVYALGVMLYEMLSGQLPTAAADRSAEPDPAPLVPSKIPGGWPAASGGDRRDLDAICSRATALLPEDRYPTVDALAEDVRRMLTHHPVQALDGAPGVALRKFVRRHRTGVTLAALVLAGFVAAGAVILAQSRRLAEQRDVALAERAAAEQLSSFLVDVFGSSDPAAARGREVPARELLDHAAARLLDPPANSAAAAQRPADRARFLHAIARAYDRLGLYREQAQTLAAARRSVVEAGGDGPSAATLLAEQAGAHLQLGELDEAEALLADASTDIAEPDRLALQSKRAHLRWLRGDLEQAEALFLEVLPGLRALPGPETSHRYFQVVANLGSVYSHLGRFDEAGELYEEAIGELTRRLGADHPTTLMQRGNLATLWLRRQRYAESRELLLPLLADKRRVLGDDHADTLRSVNGLAIAEHYTGNLEAAEALFREALSASERTLSPDHRETLALLANLAAVLIENGKLEEGRGMHRRVFEGFRDQLGPAHRFTGLTLHNLAGANALAGEHATADRQYREVQQILDAALPADHPEQKMNLEAWVALRRQMGNPEGTAALEARLSGMADR
ncbi:hypothetical protein ABI59_17220 [Acidobacteria bacterium Mor1]|nr:hypothetical protein ABI59_17220 [Acidobacteria bacterium Mor1]